MPQNNGVILGADGKPVASEAGVPEMTAEEKTMSAEIYAMMGNPNIQQYGMAIVAGAQLSAWGEHHLCRHGSYSLESRRAMLQIIQGSMISADGSPRQFDEVVMATHLEELMPFVTKKVKKHRKEAKKAQADAMREAADTATDKIIDAKDKFGKSEKAGDDAEVSE